MSEPVFVSENISRIEDAIKQYQDNIDNTEKHIEEIRKDINNEKNEILRLEGCLLTFKGFRDAGIERIMTTEEQENLRSCADGAIKEREEFILEREKKVNEDIRKLERYENELREREQTEDKCDPTVKEWISDSCHMI
jgi:chromosome segregation ATPase